MSAPDNLFGDKEENGFVELTDQDDLELGTSPGSPFVREKHGSALRRLETHGSIKTLPYDENEEPVQPPTASQYSLLMKEYIKSSNQPQDHDFRPQEYGHGNHRNAAIAPDSPLYGNGQLIRQRLPSWDFPTARESVHSNGGQGSPLFDDIVAYEEAGVDDSLAANEAARQYGYNSDSRSTDSRLGLPALHPSRDSSLIQLNEYVWSQPPSDDGQEALLMDNAAIQPDTVDSSLHHLDFQIPAAGFDIGPRSSYSSISLYGQMRGSREMSLQNCAHYSGLIKDGSTSQPMSENEIEEELARSLGTIVKTGLREPGLSDPFTQADRHLGSIDTRGVRHFIHAPEPLRYSRTLESTGDVGPGSSQTSSSLSADRFAGCESGRKGRRGFYDGIQPSKFRKPTPPLLFGRHVVRRTENVEAESKPSLQSSNSRLNQVVKANCVEEGHLGEAISRSGYQDWETVSDIQEVTSPIAHDTPEEDQTGSSLADNSDSGNISLTKQGQPVSFCANNNQILRHPADLRYNHSYLLLKDWQTGEMVQMPQYIPEMGGRVPYENATINRYQHPGPIIKGHEHPFTSLPPNLSPVKDSSTKIDNNQQKAPMHEPLSSDLSDNVSELVYEQHQNSLYKAVEGLFHDSEQGTGQNRHVTGSKEQSHQSSVWLSTVSDDDSGKRSLPFNRGSFTKITLLGRKGNVTETPKGKGAREVGSSLADASSAGVNLSSSPILITGSTLSHPNTLPQEISVYPRSHKQDLGCGSQDTSPTPSHLQGTYPAAIRDQLELEDPANPAALEEGRLRSLSASGPHLRHRKPSPRRRRSSSESNTELMASPLAGKASALHSTGFHSHSNRIAKSGPLPRDTFVHSDDEAPAQGSLQQGIMEPGRNSVQTYNGTNDESAASPSIASSRPFVREGVIHTDVPLPRLDHPLYGFERPWDQSTQTRGRPKIRPNQLKRPVALAHSPHLHHIPRPPTRELLQRQVLLSRIYLVAFMLLGPCALIFGHGYADGIMRNQTHGEINGFRDTEKIVALYLGYGSAAAAMLAIVTVIIFVTVST